MSKAYDRVEWSYLEKIMRKMGFDEKWVALMMECITLVSYSILINGDPTNVIRPSKGTRQGDPLSFYLFLLCTEGLHSILHQVKEAGHICGVFICKKGLRLTHLFLADNSLIFCRASILKCQKVQSLLSCYEKASRQLLNMHKMSLFFSKSTHPDTLNQIKASLGA